MTLIHAWSGFFTSDARSTGRLFQSQGRVTYQPGDGNLVRATVEDDQGNAFEVSIQQHGGDATAQCTCEAFERGTFCAHIWAVLLDLEQRESAEGEATEKVQLQRLMALSPKPPRARKRRAREERPREAEPAWIGRLSLLRPVSYSQEQAMAPTVAMPRQVCYLVQPELSVRHAGLVVELRQRHPTRGGWSSLKPLRIAGTMLRELEDPQDRQICGMLLGASRIQGDEDRSRYGEDRQHGTFKLPPGAWRTLLRRMIETGRCFTEQEDGELTPLTWDRGPGSEDEGQPWVLWATGREIGGELEVNLELRRGESRMGIDVPTLVLPGPDGLVIVGSKASAFDDADAARWVTQFRDDRRKHGESSPLRVPLADVDRFLDHLYSLPQLPETDLPSGLGRQALAVSPQPQIELHSSSGSTAALLAQQLGQAAITPSTGGSSGSRLLTARVSFRYGPVRVRPGQEGRFIQAADEHPDLVPSPEQMQMQASGLRLVRRDLRLEQQHLGSLAELGLRPNPADNGQTLQLRPTLLGQVAQELQDRGWEIWIDQREVRTSKAPSLSIATGIDWLELRGGVTYQTSQGSQVVSLPEILAAARSGRSMIRLQDGSEGMLPTAWLESHQLLATVGQVHGEIMRFRPSQAILLDSLLAEHELESVDEGFQGIRERLRQIGEIQPRLPQPSFQGQLRPYQQAGYGWMSFLRDLRMGGILADDMGLGKTVQVLALLDEIYFERRSNPERPHQPSLIVVPRSVVHNWLDEAARFAPQLRIAAYSGADRTALLGQLDAHDVLVTSYGLLRRDIHELRATRFDTVVLDEAQAIKNPKSQAAKAARVVRCDHRIALTGTPVENHLGDLWSIFEFLNPGMLGSNLRFAELVKSGMNDPRNADSARSAARALRPFILRRTKKQVLADLPEKTEQTIYCEMELPQRQLYDQLLAHYRTSLLAEVDRQGMGRSTLVVLEALLRLRQACCHPGLIDPGRSGESSAKLVELLDRLEEMIDEGHKALVFSQFTSMLAIVRERLEARGVQYEYLDGQTSNRAERVEAFQNNPDTHVFLISLKAGGLGLNLTAADYVFILDPWWNPAVESQAIDRAHRIGQTRPVFAYRLICEDTVEQRIAELQDQKRRLADAIIDGEQQNLLSQLTREDLDRLLS